MMKRFRSISRLLFISLFLLGLHFPGGETVSAQADAQNQAASADEAPPEAEADSDTDSRSETLNALLFTRLEIREQLKVRNHELTLEQNPEEIEVIKKDIERLKQMSADVEKDLAVVASGVDLALLDEAPPEKFNLENEIGNLTAPLIRELKKMTERPRQIESLRSQISGLESRLSTIQAGIENMGKLMAAGGGTPVRMEKFLKGMEDEWREKQKKISEDLRVSRYRLEELTKERTSLWESSQEMVKSFFRHRGRNSMLALAAFFITFIAMRFGHRLISQHSPTHRGGGRNFSVRLMDVIYHILTVLASLGAVIFVLYMSGDWLLLSIALIFLLGLIWTAKEGIPRFWRQIQLMLNLGMVKEGERLIYNGVPWRVEELNFYARLKNPSLKPSELKVPLKEMVGLISRGYDPDEPWFPCAVGEWVILSDGTRGEIVSQTPEMVQLGLRGGATKTYQTGDFLGSTPINLSGTFRRKLVFGFDYAHQDIITTEMPAILTQALKQGLTEAGYGSDLIQLRVEVVNAAASSIDLGVNADFNGKLAPNYNSLYRLMLKLIIEEATRQNWGIPYPQVTVHTAGPLQIEGSAKPVLADVPA